MRPARKNPLTVQSYFSGSLPHHIIRVQSQAPLCCSHLLYAGKEQHRLMRHCPTFRNSVPREAGTPAAGASDADLTGSPLPGLHLRRVQLELCSTGTRPRGQRDTAARNSAFCSLLLVWIWLRQERLWRLGALLKTQAAAGIRSLPACVRALTCPVIQRNLCSQKCRMWQSR